MLSGAEPQPPFTELPVSRHKMVLLTWAGIYPTITLVLWLLLPTLLEYLPLPLMTLVVTGIVVPLMSYVVMPTMVKVFRPWLRRRRPAATQAARNQEPTAQPQKEPTLPAPDLAPMAQS